MKSKKLKSISYKLIIAFLTVILSLIILIWIMQALLLKPSYSWFREKQIDDVTEHIKESMNYDNFNNEMDEISIKNDCNILILDNSMNVIYQSNQFMTSEPKGLLKEIDRAVQDVKSEKVDRNFILSKTKISYHIHAEHYEDYYFVVISRLAPVEATVQVIESQLMIISIIAIIISVVIAIFISKRIAKPIKEISQKAKKLSEEKFDLEFNNREYIEIKELSETLDKASKELKEKDRIKKEIIANVSHDLKTPLSIIQGYCEMLQDITGDDKEKRNEQLGKIQKETNNLTLMINDMLDLSRLENDNFLKIEKFDISELIKETINRLGAITEKENIKIEYSPKNCFVNADKTKMGQALYNLLANAINFVGEDKKIFVNQTEKDGKTRIEIEDNGIGIDEKDLPHIFDRYYKTNNRYRKSGVSTGIGLSIVKTIFEQHKLSYGVESKKGEGTKF